MSGMKNSKTGGYIGTGAEKTIAGDLVGFKPAKVSIYRGTTRLDKCEHIEGMADATHFLDKGDDGVRSLVSTQGITLTEFGFTVGTDASVNNSGDTYYFHAEE